MSAPTVASTIYERLGGMVSIDVAVDRFYGRVIGDPELAPCFDSVDVRRLRAHQKAFLAMTLGGPRRHAGRGLAEAHRHLAIDDHHVDLVAGRVVQLDLDAEVVAGELELVVIA